MRWQEESLADEAEASRSIESVRHMLENFELVRSGPLGEGGWGSARLPESEDSVHKKAGFDARYFDSDNPSLCC